MIYIFSGKKIKEHMEFDLSGTFLIKTKNLSLISFIVPDIVYLALYIYTLDIVPNIMYRIIKWGLKRLSNDVSCDMFWCIKKLPF